MFGEGPEIEGFSLFLNLEILPWSKGTLTESDSIPFSLENLIQEHYAEKSPFF
jgi:hypothetical protein